MDNLILAQGVGRSASGGMKLHNYPVLPEFSAFHRATAEASGEPGVTEKAPEAEAEAAAGPRPEPLAPKRADTRTKRTHIAAPPFSWLGGNAWPDFPSRPDIAY
jgi:hypothetical protein